jgi:hypothetical protein
MLLKNVADVKRQPKLDFIWVQSFEGLSVPNKIWMSWGVYGKTWL